MTKLFDSPAELGEYVFRITDNCGRSYDRYTVTFSDGDYYALNQHPTHPLGFSQSGEGINPAVQAQWVEEGDSIDLALGDLPEGLAQHVVSRLNHATQDFLDAVEAKDPKWVAKSRDEATVHEGISTSFGDGIYLSGDAYMIRLDGYPEDDLGPYDNARDAVRATLPDHYAMSGPEYHSTVDVTRLDPDPEVLAKVAALEAEIDEANLPKGGIFDR